MIKIDELKQGIKQLPPDDLQLFREWFDEWFDEIELDTVPTAVASKQSGTKFLLGLAGTFDTGFNSTSENVHDLVANVIREKYEKETNDRSD